MLKPLASTLFQGSQSALTRFPVPFLCILLFCIISLTDSAKTPDSVLPTLFCGCFWMISTHLVAESRGWARPKLYLLGLGGILVIGAYLWTLPKIDVPFALLGAACFLSMFIAPFLRSGVSPEAIWTFNYRMWMRIALATLAGFVLFLGLVAINEGMQYLFDLPRVYDSGQKIWLFVATFFSPLFALAGIPHEFDAVETEYPKPIRLIVSFILLPLLLVYAVLLYLYIGKIAVTWTLPEGGVVYLVSGFGAVGTVIWLASVPLHSEAGFVATFARNFYRILCVPLLLLAVGIGIRVMDYGITEERYVVMLCLLWLAASSLFALISASRQAPRFIYLSLISLLALASFGPWGAVGLSSFSQISRLEKILTEAGVLVDGRLVMAQGPVNRKNAAEISSLMDYLDEEEQLQKILPWFGVPVELQEPGQANNYKSQANTLMEKMNIKYVESWERSSETGDYRRIDYQQREYPSFSDVRGYDYYVPTSYVYQTSPSGKQYVLSETLTIDTGFDLKAQQLTFTDTRQARVVKFALDEIVRAYDKGEGPQFVLTGSDNGLQIKLIIKGFSAETKNEAGAPIELKSIDFEFMVKDAR